MAAHEQKNQRVVFCGDLSGGRFLKQGQAFAISPGLVTSPLIDHPPDGRVHEPTERFRRNAIARPVHGRREQRLLNRVFRSVKVTRPPDEYAKDLRRKVAQQVLHTRRHVQRSPPTC